MQDRIQELEQECKELRARAEKAEDMVRILEQVIKLQNSRGATGEAVAITADGKVYMGSYHGQRSWIARIIERLKRESK